MQRYYLGTAETPDDYLEPLEDQVCHACKGRKRRWMRTRNGSVYGPCPDCGGSGVEEDCDDQED